MARYEIFEETTSYKRRKLAGRSPGNDDELIFLNFFLHIALEDWRTRLEYYAPLKKGFILQSKGAHFKKIRRRGENIFHFTSASRGSAWPLHFKVASYAYVFNLYDCFAHQRMDKQRQDLVPSETIHSHRLAGKPERQRVETIFHPQRRSLTFRRMCTLGHSRNCTSSRTRNSK